MKKSLLILGLLLAAAAFFEWSPAVKEARSYVSPANYENPDTLCGTILTGRPWYGTLNYWFLAWLIGVPALIFSASPHSPARLRNICIVAAASLCYALMNLAVHLQWEIRNAPFKADPVTPDPLNGWRMDCAGHAGEEFSRMLNLYLGWIPACIYTSLCLFAWHFYHRRLSKKITENYKKDNVTKILFIGLKTYMILILSSVVFSFAFFSYSNVMGDFLFPPPLLGAVLGPVFLPLIMAFFVFMI